MKIRTGFVSNSSSSSFTILGVNVDLEYLCSLVGKKLEYFDEDDYEDEWEIYEEVSGDLLKILPSYFSVECDQEQFDCWIGVKPQAIPLDSTIREIRGIVVSELSRLNPDDPCVDSEIFWHEVEIRS